MRHFLEDIFQKEGEVTQWFYADPQHKPRGVAVVTHGLNLRPEKMYAIIRILNQEGIDAINVSLRGHGDNYRRRSGTAEAEDRLASFTHVAFLVWLREVHEAYLKALLRARRYGVPIYFAGYSLGGLLGCTLVLSHPQVHFHKMIFFSPSLVLQKKSYLLKPLQPFSGFVIDSLSPEDYRANSGTPIGAYNALFDALQLFTDHAHTRLNIPTLVVIDAQDEFIDYDGLQTFISAHRFNKWQFHVVEKDESLAMAIPHHLIIDELCTGTEAWQNITAALQRFLKDPQAKNVSR